MTPDTIAGRYRVERAVGRGGMGTVWLCRDELLGRQVAVKQVGTLPGEAPPDLARALREARSSAALNHRNVVSVYDTVDDGDQLWLVMEYVPSRTLSQLLASDGPMSPERAAWIGAQVADGLSAAHAQGTIHRDVKPGNILVTDDDVAKVSDFGIARTYGDPTLTDSGFVSGTPLYFSPELARGEEPGPPADVWALGASLYTAVEGRPPYPKQSNPLAMLTTILAGEPPPPERAGFLGPAINRMLDRSPTSRWSMADAVHVLHRLHDEHPVPTPDATAAYTTGAAVESPPAVSEDAVTTGLPLEQRPAMFAEPPARPSSPTSDEAPDALPGSGPAASRRRSRWLAPLAAVVLLALVVAGGLALLHRPQSSPGAARARATSPTRSPSSPAQSTGTKKPSATSSPSKSASSSSSPSSSATTGSSPSAAGAQSGQRFVSSYYAALPGDTQRGWSLLSPQYRSRLGGYGSYRGFWATINQVSVSSTAPAGPDAVDVSLTYRRNDGTMAKEVRRIFLEHAGSGLRISRDQPIG